MKKNRKRAYEIKSSDMLKEWITSGSSEIFVAFGRVKNEHIESDDDFFDDSNEDDYMDTSLSLDTHLPTETQLEE